MITRGNRKSSLLLLGFTLVLAVAAAFGIWSGYEEKPPLHITEGNVVINAEYYSRMP